MGRYGFLGKTHEGFGLMCIGGLYVCALKSCTIQRARWVKTRFSSQISEGFGLNVAGGHRDALMGLYNANSQPRAGG